MIGDLATIADATTGNEVTEAVAETMHAMMVGATALRHVDDRGRAVVETRRERRSERQAGKATDENTSECSTNEKLFHDDLLGI
jgi:hypothetical protein